MRRDGRSRRGRNRLAVMRITIEARKIAAGDLQSDAMAPPKHNAGRPQYDLDTRGLRGRGVAGLPICLPDDSVRDVVRHAVAMYVDELRREVSGRSRCRHPLRRDERAPRAERPLRAHEDDDRITITPRYSDPNANNVTPNQERGTTNTPRPRVTSMQTFVSRMMMMI